MFNVDTITLGMNLEERRKPKETVNGRTKEMIDYKYIYRVEAKFKQKLYLDNENRKKLENIELRKQREKILHNYYNRVRKDRDVDVFRYGKDNYYSFCYNQTLHTFLITLKHPVIERYTAEEIMQNVKQEIMDYFNITEEELNQITLRRIDYYCDYRYRDTEELEVIKNIMSKTRDTIYSYKKEITDKPDKYVVKYLSLKNNKESKEVNIAEYSKVIINQTGNKEGKRKMKYKEHQEESSRYTEITVYDKMKEIERQITEGRISENVLFKYINIFRIEVKVKNGKLNSYKSQDKLRNKEHIRTKELENYYNYKALNRYYSNMANRIFGEEIFYRVDVAVKKVNGCKELKHTMKEKLCSLLQLINREGYTKAKEIWEDKYSKPTFNSHMNKIKALEINIITFDARINGKKIEYETIPNFALLCNAVIENEDLKITSVK